MPTTAKITDHTGKEVEINVFSPADLKAFVEDKSNAGMKAAFAYLKALGRPVGEIISMDPATRFEWITKRYAELGIASAGGAKKKGPTPVGAAKTKAAPAPAAPQNAEDDEDEETETETEEEEEAAPAKVTPITKAKSAVTGVAARATTAPAASAGVDAGALQQFMQTVLKELKELRTAVETTATQVSQLQDEEAEQTKLLVDIHFITRVMGPQLTGMDDDSIIELGNQMGVLGTRLIELPAEEEEGGND